MTHACLVLLDRAAAPARRTSPLLVMVLAAHAYPDVGTTPLLLSLTVLTAARANRTSDQPVQRPYSTGAGLASRGVS